MRAGSVVIVSWLAAAGCAEPEPQHAPLYPTGELEAAFLFWMPTGTAYSTRPTARITLDGDRAVATIAETWRIDSPLFGDCPTTVEFEGELDWPSTLPWATFAGAGELDEDPCNIQPYGEDLTLVLTVMPLMQARVLIEDAVGLDMALMNTRQFELELERGQGALPWFLFWGEEPDALWPIGHLFVAR